MTTTRRGFFEAVLGGVIGAKVGAKVAPALVASSTVTGRIVPLPDWWAALEPHPWTYVDQARVYVAAMGLPIPKHILEADLSYCEIRAVDQADFVWEELDDLK